MVPFLKLSPFCVSRVEQATRDVPQSVSTELSCSPWFSLLPPPPRRLALGCAQDGRLAAGDQLLSVDGRSLVGLSQERYHCFICLKLNTRPVGGLGDENPCWAAVPFLFFKCQTLSVHFLFLANCVF